MNSNKKIFFTILLVMNALKNAVYARNFQNENEKAKQSKKATQNLLASQDGEAFLKAKQESEQYRPDKQNQQFQKKSGISSDTFDVNKAINESKKSYEQENELKLKQENKQLKALLSIRENTIEKLQSNTPTSFINEENEQLKEFLSIKDNTIKILESKLHDQNEYFQKKIDEQKNLMIRKNEKLNKYNPLNFFILENSENFENKNAFIGILLNNDEFFNTLKALRDNFSNEDNFISNIYNE